MEILAVIINNKYAFPHLSHSKIPYNNLVIKLKQINFIKCIPVSPQAPSWASRRTPQARAETCYGMWSNRATPTTSESTIALIQIHDC